MLVILLLTLTVWEFVPTADESVAELSGVIVTATPLEFAGEQGLLVTIALK